MFGIQVKEEKEEGKERGDWEEYELRVLSPLSHTLLHISKRENIIISIYKYIPILYKDIRSLTNIIPYNYELHHSLLSWHIDIVPKKHGH